MNTPITINPDRIELDEAYMQMAEVWAKRSKANRLQVGALIVKDKQIISDGYNGMPSGVLDDVCEYWFYDGNRDREPGYTGEMRTKPEGLHAESNALMKIAENGGVGAQGATLYTTYSPCPECAKLIKQAKIARVVYRNEYRLPDGINLLRKLGVSVERLAGGTAQEVHQPIPPSPVPQPNLVPQQNQEMQRLVQARAAAPVAPVTVPQSQLLDVDPDVARLLQEFEAHQAAQAAGANQLPAASKQDPTNSANTSYRSSFL